MKKKSLWIAVICLLPAVASAQFHWGVKGGANIATVKFNKDVVNSENITGLQIGPVIEYIRPTSGWGFDAALLFTQKGFNGKEKTVKNNFLEVPVNVKWKLMAPLVKPFVAVGPYLDFRIDGRKFWQLSDIYHDATGQLKSRSFGAGLNFSAGAEALGFLQLSLTYGLGLTDDYRTFEMDDLKGSGKTHTWSISAAVFF